MLSDFILSEKGNTVTVNKAWLEELYGDYLRFESALYYIAHGDSEDPRETASLALEVPEV